uniref:Ankyrin repeat and zinc finger domain-containing protein 1 n=1 Tax=Tanacetum cinerariifolium TaxID=118510 RepID=A0A699HML3_TANCI|nr:ankyrin repeat and zinc finger domain-containing protein 1 [Tanacetum cinerariifolium]
MEHAFVERGLNLGGKRESDEKDDTCSLDDGLEDLASRACENAVGHQFGDQILIMPPEKTHSTLECRKSFRTTRTRRFMALNLDKWDSQAAKVPSPLTKEMEESQNAKQAEKVLKGKQKPKS